MKRKPVDAAEPLDLVFIGEQCDKFCQFSAFMVAGYLPHGMEPSEQGSKQCAYGDEKCTHFQCKLNPLLILHQIIP